MIELRAQPDKSWRSQTFTNECETVHMDGREIGTLWTHHEYGQTYIAYATSPDGEHRKLGLYSTPQSALEAIVWWIETVKEST